MCRRSQHPAKPSLESVRSGTTSRETLNRQARRNLSQGLRWFCHFTTILLKFPSVPAEAHRCFCQQVPARNWNESLQILRVAGVEELSSPPTPRCFCFWQRLGCWQGRPASAQSAPGGGGFLLLPITSFFICGRTFFGTWSSFLHVWLTVPLLIYFFGMPYVVLRCQKVCTKYWNEGWIYTLQLPGGMGC